MKYIIFAGQSHYPHAGISSIIGGSDGKSEAIELAKSVIGSSRSVVGNKVGDYGPDEPIDWWQVVDSHELALVARDGSAHQDDDERLDGLVGQCSGDSNVCQ